MRESKAVRVCEGVREEMSARECKNVNKCKCEGVRVSESVQEVVQVSDGMS